MTLNNLIGKTLEEIGINLNAITKLLAAAERNIKLEIDGKRLFF